METWSIAETRDLVKTRFGKDQLNLISPSLNSVVERRDFAQYHFLEIQSLLGKFKTEYLERQPRTLFIIFTDETYKEAFWDLMLEVGAHATAAVQSLHAIHDILSHVGYYGLGINLSENLIKQHHITYNCISSIMSKNTKYISVSKEFDQLARMTDYKYILGLANKSKHQSIVRPFLSEDLTGTRTQRHELQFSEFEYKGDFFPKSGIELMLSKSYENTSKVLVNVGNSLNAYLRNVS